MVNWKLDSAQQLIVTPSYLELLFNQSPGKITDHIANQILGKIVEWEFDQLKYWVVCVYCDE